NSAQSTRLRWMLKPLFGITLVAFVAIVIVQGSGDYRLPLMKSIGFTAIGLCALSLVGGAYLYSGSSSALLRILRQPILRRIGKYSYCIYIVHFPIAFFLLGVCRRLAGVEPI